MKKEQRTTFIIKLFLPAIFTVVLFLISFFRIVIPEFEKNLMDGKRETIYELTQTACSILEKYHQEVLDSVMPLEEAQKMAADEISQLRYGAENKDYFWITDMHPNMIRHPYRSDLNGQDLSGFSDPQGKKLFVEFVKTVEQSGEGYVDYMWQWKDDSSRIVPKLSYVRGFKPWGWIVGTGIYIEDVKTGIARLENRLIIISSIITGLIIILLTFVLRLSMKADSRRIQAEKDLKASRDRYKALVEAATEGTVMMLEGKLFANQTFLKMSGLAENELSPEIIFEMLSIERLSGCKPEDIASLPAVFHEPLNTEWSLNVPGRERISVLLNVSKATVMEREAVIFTLRHLQQGESSTENSLQNLLSTLGLAGFSSTFSRRSRFKSVSPALVQLMHVDSASELFDGNIDMLFADHMQREYFLRTLLTVKKITDYTMLVRRPDRTTFNASISAALHNDELSGETICSGIISETTHLSHRVANLKAVIDDFHSPGFAAGVSLAALGREVVSCTINDSISGVAGLMKRFSTDVVVVNSENGLPLGFVTVNDVLFASVNSNGMQKPVYEIMRSPLPLFEQNASLWDVIATKKENEALVVFFKDPSQTLQMADLRMNVLFDSFYVRHLCNRVEQAVELREMVELHAKLKTYCSLMLRSGMNSDRITAMMSSFSSAVTSRVIQMSLSEIGESPCRWAFLNLGSVGRDEQTFVTDQDNAIIFEHEEPEKVRPYFVALGRSISNKLHVAGFEYCAGDMMASNPKWVASLREWEKYFASWFTRSEPKHLLEISVFFDFTTAYGDNSLAERLRETVSAISQQQGAFYYNLAQSILQYKAPVNTPGILGNDPSQSERIDLKNAVAQLVMMIRLYSIQQGLHDSNTLRRLLALQEKGIFNEVFVSEFSFNFRFLNQLRLLAQLDAIDSGQRPTNTIVPSKLAEAERQMLRKVLGFFTSCQTKIGYDFTGNM